MKASYREDVCGSRGGRAMLVVELDQEAYKWLLGRTRKHLADDWVLIGKSAGSMRDMVAVATTNPEAIVRHVRTEGGYAHVTNPRRLP